MLKMFDSKRYFGYGQYTSGDRGPRFTGPKRQYPTNCFVRIITTRGAGQHIAKKYLYLARLPPC